MIDIKRLGHVVALAEERHFARAAERVHLSQPAFSRSIQTIEQDLGLRLFDREAGDVAITPAGSFLVERARQLLFDARTLQRELELYRDSSLGDTAFGAGPFPAAAIMRRAVPELRRRFPAVRLRLEVTNWKVLYERLLNEDIEFFVGDLRDLPADPRIAIAPLGRMPAHIYARASHPLAGRPCSFREVWDHGFAATKMPQVVKGLLAQLLQLPPSEAPRLAFECDDIGVLRALALETDTAVGVPDAAVAADEAAGLLVRLQLTDLPEVYAETAVVSLANRTYSPMARHVLACIAELMQ